MHENIRNLFWKYSIITSLCIVLLQIILIFIGSLFERENYGFMILSANIMVFHPMTSICVATYRFGEKVDRSKKTSLYKIFMCLFTLAITLIPLIICFFISSDELLPAMMVMIYSVIWIIPMLIKIIVHFIQFIFFKKVEGIY